MRCVYQVANGFTTSSLLQAIELDRQRGFKTLGPFQLIDLHGPFQNAFGSVLKSDPQFCVSLSFSFKGTSLARHALLEPTSDPRLGSVGEERGVDPQLGQVCRLLEAICQGGAPVFPLAKVGKMVGLLFG